MNIDSIPTNEVLQDISDTEAEIKTMKREIEGHRLIGDRMSHFRADAKVQGIKEREMFIEKLQKILADRGFLSESKE